MNKNKTLFPVSYACKLVPGGITRQTVSNWTRKGYRGRCLPSVRAGKRLLIDPDELQKFVEYRFPNKTKAPK